GASPGAQPAAGEPKMAAAARVGGAAALALCLWRLASSLGFLAGSAPGAPCLLYSASTRGSRTLRRQRGTELAVRVSCRNVAALAGRHFPGAVQSSWREVIKQNFRPTYESLASVDRRLLTPEDSLRAEMEALDPAEREALRSMQAEAVASAGAPLECSPSEVAPSLSRAGADSVLREIRLQRGIDELGLGTAQEAERQSAAGVQSRIARLERSLREEEERPVQSVVDEVARKRTQEQLRAEIESLRKERSLLLAEFLPGGGGSEISKPFISGTAASSSRSSRPTSP
ncbi:unnamed protein product, partial [Prorocentrum cordatum]